jgi:hypothetical protein
VEVNDGSFKYEEVYLKSYRSVREMEAGLDGWFAFYNQADRPQPRPAREPRQLARRRQLDVSSRLLAAVARVPRLMAAGIHAREVVLPPLVDVGDHRLVQLLVVPLQRQDIIPLRLDDLAGDLLLRPHRVDRDDRLLNLHELE